MGLFGNLGALGGRTVSPMSPLVPLAAGARQAGTGQAGLLADPVIEPTGASAGQGLIGGLRGFLHQAQQPGGFFERLNTFGATLQDVDDGGNRAALLRQQRQQEAAAAEAAAQRANINRLAQSLNLSPRDQLIFNADPEAFLRIVGERENDERDAAAKAGEVDYLNTSRGVYRTGPNPGWQEEFTPDPPDVDFGWRVTPNGGLEPIPGGPADPRYLGGRAAATRAPPRPRAARTGSGSSARAPWERSW